MLDSNLVIGALKGPSCRATRSFSPLSTLSYNYVNKLQLTLYSEVHEAGFRFVTQKLQELFRCFIQNDLEN